ncbi:hypothetical protein MmiHf6_13980 [Methanimicrococcus hongohii]|uniref:Uncharacterized protein n=1 Tax=Methanimicrococcus hongohii TaxID=3028295 RepID=A0AA96V1D7_9EURY|nr:hypothetical protein [Methanimicrococcus sp. Hf6]WNY24073.1 hypothetical protein MmiHf6_13980 [Methanimicrococcus sp. Hf6]
MKKIYLIIILMAIIVSILPHEHSLLLISVHTLVLFIYGIRRYPLLYTYVKNNVFLSSKEAEGLIVLISNFIYPLVFLLISMILISQIINIFTPFTLQYVLNSPILNGVSFIVSGFAFVFAVDYLTKLINVEDKITTGDSVNE